VALLVIIGVSLYAWYTVSRRGANEAGKPDANSSGAAPTLPRPPVTASLLNGNPDVEAGQIQWINFAVPVGAFRVSVTGSFHAFGGSGNDIWVTLTTPVEFENWRNGHEARLFYNSGKTTNSEIAVKGLPPGSYVLAFDNRFSALSRKGVTGSITLTYSH